MATHPLLAQLLTLPTLADQKALLRAERAQLDEPFVNALKDLANQQLRADAHAALDTAALLYCAAALTGNPLSRALALFAEANAWAIGGLGEYQRAIDLCDEAAAIYAHANRTVEQADAQVTKIYALAMLGRYGEALAAGEWAATVLTAEREWARLATVTMNVAIVYGRMGKDTEALVHFDRAGALYRDNGAAGAWSLPGVEMNRALVLRNLGRFPEALAANHSAIEQLHALGQHGEVGHAQQTLAFTYYLLGRTNEALQLLDAAERTFAQYDRRTDQLLTALYRNHCLLTVGRLGAVVAMSERLAEQAAQLGQRMEEGHALLQKASALAGMGQTAQALDLLTAARALFAGEGNVVWAAEAELTAATLLIQLARWEAALDKANGCATIFAAHNLPVHTARAHLAVADALLQRGDGRAAAELLHPMLELATTNRLPNLGYRAYYLLGRATEGSDDAAALRHYDAALHAIEALRARLMVEDRPHFLVDKEEVYAAAVRLSLAQHKIAAAHAYVERARARSLHDLLALRIDLRVHPRNRADAALVAELNQLRQARDHYYRRLHYEQGFAAIVMSPPTPSPTTVPVETQATASEPPASIALLEEQISTCWHTLLIRNAAYARDDIQGEIAHNSPATDHPAELTAIQAQLRAHTCLLSYYVNADSVILFLLTTETITAHPLPATANLIRRLSDLLQLNINMAAASDSTQQPALLRHAQTILHQLYQQLLAPVWDRLAAADTLIVAPHGPLHYVPFHALVTEIKREQPLESRYLLDTHTIHYTPGATFLTVQHQTPQSEGNILVFGHSYGGQLPETLTEAHAIATLMGGHVFTESAATKAKVTEVAPTARLLHLATHGDFRADNPLFSGLALEDGWLSTLDIFHLHINGALVTLSACRTGRNVGGGGDEQLGLMRAFLAAGASSLVLSHWAVHDHSTAILMQQFYHALLNGQPKGRALRSAQTTLRDTQSTDGSSPYAHPYFWAPFLLVGDAGPF